MKKTILVLALAALLSACGGGGADVAELSRSVTAAPNEVEKRPRESVLPIVLHPSGFVAQPVTVAPPNSTQPNSPNPQQARLTNGELILLHPVQSEQLYATSCDGTPLDVPPDIVLFYRQGFRIQRIDAEGNRLPIQDLHVECLSVHNRRPPVTGVLTSVVPLSTGGYAISYTDILFSTTHGQLFRPTVLVFNQDGSRDGDAIDLGKSPDDPSAGGLITVQLKPNNTGGLVIHGHHAVYVHPTGYTNNAYYMHRNADGVVKDLSGLTTDQDASLLTLPNGTYVFFEKDASGTSYAVAVSADLARGTPVQLPAAMRQAIALEDGSYMVSYLTADVDKAQRFSADGTPMTEVFSFGKVGGMAALPDGGFALTWSGASGPSDLFTQHFTPPALVSVKPPKLPKPPKEKEPKEKEPKGNKG